MIFTLIWGRWELQGEHKRRDLYVFNFPKSFRELHVGDDIREIFRFEHFESLSLEGGCLGGCIDENVHEVLCSCVLVNLEMDLRIEGIQS